MIPRHPAFWGGVVAPLLWTGLIAASLDVINPALNERIDWPWFVASQIAFGLVAGLRGRALGAHRDLPARAARARAASSLETAGRAR